MKVTVVDPSKPREVTITEGSAIPMYEGTKELTLHATVVPSTAVTQLEWSIPKKQEKIATINKATGVITAGEKKGTVTVTVKTTAKKANKKQATAKIKVTVGANPAVPFSVKIVEPGKKTLKVGDTLTLSASIEPITATEQTALTWSSSNKNVAEVNKETGVFTAQKKGSVTITVKTANGKKDTIKLTVE